jgi:hypothetical protein
VTEPTVRLPRLHPTLEGFTIVQVTDIHVGPTSAASSWTTWWAGWTVKVTLTRA